MFAVLKSFKAKLMITVLVFGIISLLSFSMYFLKSLSAGILREEVMVQMSINQMLYETMDASYYRHVYFMLSSLQGLRKRHAAAAHALCDVYASSNQHDGKAKSAVRSVIQNSLIDSSYRVIIYNQQDPQQSVYVRSDYRRMLNYQTVQVINLKELLDHYNRDHEMYFFYLRDPETKEEYLSSVTPLDHHQLVVLVSSLNQLTDLRLSMRTSILDNIKLPLDSINLAFKARNSWQHYILDRTGKVIEPRSMDLKLDFTESFIHEIKNDPDKTVTTTMEIDEEQHNLVISLYPPLNWFIVSSIPDDRLLKSQKQLNGRILYICLAVALITLVCTYFLSNSISKPLNQVTTVTQALSRLDLRDTAEVKRVLRSLDISQRQDEIGKISTILSRMILSLSLNMHQLLATQEHRRLIEGELAAAADIQQNLLPRDLDLPEYLPLNIYGFLQPAREMGGDLYDVIALPNSRLCLVIGDVSDKGVPAALFMTMTVTLIREGASLNLTPAALMDSVNNTLCQRNPNLMFVTLFIGILDKQTGEISYANGGHCQPLLTSTGGAVRALTGLSGPALGVVEDHCYTEFRDRLAEDETLLLYTDGVTEAQNRQQELFGKERLQKCLSSHTWQSMQELCTNLNTAIADFKGDAPQFDDIAMLAASLSGHLLKEGAESQAVTQD